MFVPKEYSLYYNKDKLDSLHTDCKLAFEILYHIDFLNLFRFHQIPLIEKVDYNAKLNWKYQYLQLNKHVIQL